MPLFGAEYRQVKLATDKMINQASCLTLKTDGWANISGEGIFNFMMTPEAVFFKST